VEGATFVVAVSGGADSVSLLLAVEELQRRKKLRLEFVAAHFNHGLRGKESDKDEAFVRKLAGKLGLEFESERWTTRKKGGNLEQAARDARYEFLAAIADKYQADGVLTGHTLDDQAETFLLRLVRGSGPDGLGAMAAVRPLNKKIGRQLVRPLLAWARRADTEGFCRAAKVKYRNDPMNEDEAFLRVRVRRQLIPLLQDMNPQAVPNLAALAGLLRDETAELSKLGARHLAAAQEVSKDTIDVTVLKELSAAMRKRVLRLWLEQRRGGLRRLDMKHLAAVERLVLQGTGGKTAELPGGERVSVRKGRLIFRKMKVEKSLPEN
jgi:tRNA(Ile)-lysidine synthase